MGQKNAKENKNIKYERIPLEEVKEIKEENVKEEKEEKEPIHPVEHKPGKIQQLIEYISQKNERRERMNKIMDFVKSQPEDIREGVKQNLLLFEFEYWFPSTKRIHVFPTYIDRNKLGKTIKAYKLARVMQDMYGHSMLCTDVAAVVTLLIPTDGGNIKYSSDGKIVINIENEDLNKKFCCGRAYVDSYQFLGDVNRIDKIRNSEMKYNIVSNFDSNFKYHIHHVVYENNYGKQGIGCTEGIHFFVSIERMLKYAGCKGFIAENVKSPCISPPIYEEGEGGDKENINIFMYNESIRKGDIKEIEKNITKLFGPQFFKFNPKMKLP